MYGFLVLGDRVSQALKILIWRDARVPGWLVEKTLTQRFPRWLFQICVLLKCLTWREKTIWRLFFKWVGPLIWGRAKKLLRTEWVNNLFQVIQSQCPFWSPIWRSPKLWRGHLIIPKWAQRITRFKVEFLMIREPVFFRALWKKKPSFGTHWFFQSDVFFFRQG